MNLVSNAVKFSPEGGTIYIEISDHGAGDQSEIIISVRDEGIGMDDEQ